MSEIAEIIPAESALAVFTAPDGLEPYLAQIRAEIDAFVPDITSVKGRKEVASMAYKIAQSKTALDGIGKDLADAQKEIPNKIDAARKKVRDTLDAWKDEVRKPLTEWEQAEEQRVIGLKFRIQEIDTVERYVLDGESSAELEARLAKINAVDIGDDWQEFRAKAAIVKAASVQTLTAALTVAQKREADAAEFRRLRDEAAARLRRENEERIAKEAAEQARKAAEAKAAAELEAQRKAAEDARLAAEAQAQAERDAAAKALKDAEDARLAAEAKAKADADAAAAREKALQEAAAKAEQDRKDADARAATAAANERARIEKEQAEAMAAEQAETARREADKAHRQKVNNVAKKSFTHYGFTEEQAELIVKLIAKKSIPAVTISY